MPDTRVAPEILSEYDLVLTPNLRSARLLETSRAAGQSDPAILPWAAWTASLWQSLVLVGDEDRILLNPLQTAALWERVLRKAMPQTLRPIASLVELCQSAYELACEYGASDRLRLQTLDDNNDAGIYAGWARQFVTECDVERLLPAAQLEGELTKAFLNGNAIDLQVKSCLLYGFDKVRPNQQSFIEALRRNGVHVTHMAATYPVVLAHGIDGSPALLRSMSVDQEFQHLSESVRAALDEGIRSIAIILPDMSVRSRLARHFQEAIAPGSFDTTDQRQPLWEFSEGKSLSSVTLARDALRLLSWFEKPASVEDVSEILRSPYFDFDMDLETAAELDTKVLRDGRSLHPEWSVASLARATPQHATPLQQRLLRLHHLANSHISGKKKFAEWSESVRTLLVAAGWPGIRERSSLEFQAVDRWNELLDQLASLDAIAPAVDYHEFLSRLRHAAARTLFSPENTGAPVQVMSPTESAGSTADMLWFACADEDRWNAKRSPHPLLSFALQQGCGMPGTDARRDLADATAVTKRLLQSAGSCTFSYSASNDNGEVRPSPLIAQLSTTKNEIIPPANNFPIIELEEFQDGAPLPALPDGTVVGGVSILQSQAACAFRAFAERRLFSSEIETTDLGLEPRERGTVLHKALQLFWDEAKNQDELLRHMRDGTLREELLKAVDGALLQVRGEGDWADAYRDIQRERLLRLLTVWLEYEAMRPAFRVLHTEHAVKGMEVGPLRMNLRVDRIDEINDAGSPASVLIDYKTGEPDVKGWMGERPAEPQLPVYATAAGIENVQAIAFATVKPGRGKLGFKPFPSKSKFLFRDAKEDDDLAFEQKLQEWRETLGKLAQDFANGVADVGPKEYPATCQYCAQRMLCRLNPELLDELAGETEEGVEVFS